MAGKCSPRRAMSPTHEEHTVRPGYALEEYLPPQASLDPLAAEDSLDDLLRQLQTMRRELETAHNELRKVEEHARTAVESEDADRAAATWNEKHRLLNRISEMQQDQDGAQRQLHAAIQTSLKALREERADIERQQAQQDESWTRLLATAEQMVHELHEANELRVRLDDRRSALYERLEHVAGRELSVLDESDPGALEPLTRRSSASGRKTSLPRRPPVDAARKWALYDPDAGKLVTSLAELLRLLARWYPGLRTEQERVREFLTLPNAEPLPKKLRQELEDAGYLDIHAADEM